MGELRVDCSVATNRELCCCLDKTSNWFCVLLSVWQCLIQRRKQVDTLCVKQSDKPKYIAHVLGGAV